MKLKNAERLLSLELRFVGNAEDDLSVALRRHFELHEGVCLSDLLKFLYQSCLGSFHLLELMDESELLGWIGRNLQETQPSDGVLVEELHGKKWVRLNFGPYKMKYGNDYLRIYRAFMKAKQVKSAEPTEFRKLLKKLSETFRKGSIRFVADEPGTLRTIMDFLKEYEKEDYPLLHHSKAYMAKNSSDYLVIPQSSLNEVACTDQIRSELAALNGSALDDVVKGAVDFHGHLGLFLVLGLKAGLLANYLLGKDCFRTKAIVTTEPCPPNSCFVDGIQFVTGCTLGKRNVMLRKGKGVSVVFFKGDWKLRLKVKDKTLESLYKIKSEKEAEKEATRLLNMSSSKLFEMARVKMKRARTDRL